MNFIGIDLGTSSIKAALYNEKFRVIDSSSAYYDIIQPQNGWGEQNPNDWISALDEVMTDLKNRQAEEINKVSSIGLTGQMHGLVMLDSEGYLLRNAILWLDQRCTKECEEITEYLGYDYVLEKTANPISSGFTLAKLQWVKNNQRDIYDKCRRILLPKDYIRYYLTGDFATDVSDASGMQMLNISNRDWDKDLLEKMEIPLEWLSEVYESVEITGYVKEDIAERYGLNGSVAVVAGAGDNAAAAIGCGVIKDGDAFTTIGTSGVVFSHTSNMIVDKKGRYHTFCSAVPNEWHVMGVTQACGLSIEWLKKNFYRDLNSELAFKAIENDINSVEIGASRLMFLPYLMGERSPHLDPYARGTFVGLTNTHGRKEIARSVFEGVTFSLRDCLEVMNESDKFSLSSMIITGGGAENKTLCKMLSDNYRKDIDILEDGSGTTLGAAILAAVGIGAYTNLGEAVKVSIKKKETIVKSDNNYNEYSKYFKLYRNIYSNLKDSYKILQDI